MRPFPALRVYQDKFQAEGSGTPSPGGSPGMAGLWRSPVEPPPDHHPHHGPPVPSSVTLQQLCEDFLVQHLSCFDPDSLAVLPPEVLASTVRTLTAFRKLCPEILPCLQRCRIQELQLNGPLTTPHSQRDPELLVGIAYYLGTTLQALHLLNCPNLVDSLTDVLGGLTQLEELSLNGAVRITGSRLSMLSPTITRLNLDFCNELSDSGLRALSELPNLRHLSISNCNNFTLQGLESLRQCNVLEKLEMECCSQVDDSMLSFVEGIHTLTFLNIGHCFRVGDDGISHLCGMSSLTHLSVAGTEISCSGFQCITECPSLRHLDIRSCQRLDASLSNCFRDRLPLLEELLADRTSFCDLCLEGLFSGSAPPPIHTLHCAFCPITDEGLRILAASPSVPAKLSSLVLSNTKITASGVCSHLRALTSLSRLEICDVELTEDSLRVVGSLSRLEHLILEEGNVSDRGVAKLRGLTNMLSIHVDSPRMSDFSIRSFTHMSRLLDLHLYTALIRSDGVKLLAQAHLPLRSLEICGGYLSNRACLYISKIQTLQSLNLSWNKRISDSGAAHLAVLNRLTNLSLSYTGIGLEGAQLLLDSLPCLNSLSLYGCVHVSPTLARQLHVPAALDLLGVSTP